MIRSRKRDAQPSPCGRAEFAEAEGRQRIRGGVATLGVHSARWLSLPENRCRFAPAIYRPSRQTCGLPMFGSKMPKSEKSDFGGRAGRRMWLGFPPSESA